VQAPAEQARRLCGSGLSTFLRLSASWSDWIKPRGSRALIRTSLSTLHELSFADCWVSNQPLIVGADQSPPSQTARVLNSQVQGPFIRRIPGVCHSSRESWLARNSAAQITGVSSETGCGKPVTPAHVVVQNLPTCCCGSLGSLKSMHSKCIYEIYKSMMRS